MTSWTRFFFGAGIAAVVAAGCDGSGSSSGANTTTGGTTGTGANTSTSGGSPGTGAGSNSGGSSGTGATSGASVECADGCAILSSPMTAAEQSARWQIYLSPTDLSNETLTFRIYVKSGGPEGGFQYGFQNGESLGYAGIYPWHDLSTAVGTWQDITVDLSKYAEGGAGGAGGEGGAGNEADPSAVQIINLWLESGSGSGPWTNPSVVYLDSVKSSAGTVNYEFQNGVSDLHSQSTNLAGATVIHTTLDP